ncbi:MAG TPA: site-specific integrase, partial [Chitinophagaceae bacterium]|nr:site-specific integrase [Chitinophagaceae bacterium]
TADSYRNSMESIEDFLQHKSTIKQKAVKLSFMEVNPQWLNAYEKYMINTKGRSRTTVAIYLRNLRSVYNMAIKNKEINAEYYPFGKEKYQIPSTRNTKKALSHEELQQLFKVKPQNDYQQKARDFWFFSYSCNGMNIKDIALLRHENIEGDKIVFYRAKTINTTKKDIKPVTAYLTDFSKSVIKKYGNKSKNLKTLVFDIIDDALSDEDNHWKIKNFTRFINQHIKRLAEHHNIVADISTYWARHSFATNAIRKGASMEFVSEALSHSDLKTTQNYFAGFEDSSKKELMDSLMDF